MLHVQSYLYSTKIDYLHLYINIYFVLSFFLIQQFTVLVVMSTVQSAFNFFLDSFYFFHSFIGLYFTDVYFFLYIDLQKFTVVI